MAAHNPYIQLDSLPKEVRKKVLAFITELMVEWERNNPAQEVSPKKKLIAGLAKGMATIPDDFDEPLDDFKEYME